MAQKIRVVDVVAPYGGCDPNVVSVNDIVRVALTEVLKISEKRADRIVKTINATKVYVAKARSAAKKAKEAGLVVA